MLEGGDIGYGSPFGDIKFCWINLISSFLDGFGAMLVFVAAIYSILEFKLFVYMAIEV